MGGCVNRKRASSEHVLPTTNFAETNTQLDLWTEAQITLLRRKFTLHKSHLGLDKSAFLQVFPGLQSFPPPLQLSLFRLFNPSQAGFITFREFCVALSKLLNGEREERMKLAFEGFDTDRDGKLAGVEVKMMLETCKIALGTMEMEETSKPEEMTQEEFMDWARAHLNIGEFLTVFEILPSPFMERQIIKSWQKNADRGTDRQQVFLVSAKWWEAWKLYVCYDSAHEQSPSSELNNGSRRVNRHVSYMAGDRPVEIDNSELVEPGNQLVLRGNLKGRVDYVLLVPEAWTELYSWYGGGPAIPRYMLRKGSQLVPELYPCKVTLYLADTQGKLRRDMAKSLLLSEAFTPQEVETLIRSTLKIEANRQFRMWIKEDLEWKLTETFPKSATSSREILIELPNLYAGMVEWPREKQAAISAEKNWRDFQVGDRIQVQRAPSFWTEATVTAVNSTDLDICLTKENNRVVRVSRLSEDLIPMGQRPVNVIWLHEKPEVGITGLVNVGNTCYMNCILQCIANTPLLNDFFGLGNFSHAINMENKKGYKGQVAQALGHLIGSVRNTKDMATNPGTFVACIRRLFPQFNDHFQHDSHEFLSLLFTSLHEDLLRRAANTPSGPCSLTNPSPDAEVATANEQWKDLQGGNGSVISDLCGGQTRTTIICQHCGVKTVHFETFLYLSVPIPVSAEMSVFITALPRQGGVKRYGLQVGKLATFSDIIGQIEQITEIQREKLLLAEMDSAKIFRLHESLPKTALTHLGISPLSELLAIEVLNTIPQAESLGKLTLVPAEPLSLEQLVPGQQVDVLNEKEEWTVGVAEQLRPGPDWQEAWVTYEFEGEERAEWVSRSSARLAAFRSNSKPGSSQIYLLPLLHRLLDNETGKMEAFGTPLAVAIGNWYTYADLHQEIGRVMAKFVRARGKTAVSAENVLYKVKMLDKFGFHCADCGATCPGCPLPHKKVQITALSPQIMLAVDWEPGLFDCDVVNDSSALEAEREEAKRCKSVTLQDCLGELTKEENVEMKCEKCGEMKASMKLDVWRTPDILILNLKRFFSQAGRAEKIDAMVDYPMYVFDMSEFLPSSSPNSGFTMSTSSLQSAYDLYSLVNHSGSIEGGHYTAFVQRKSQQGEEKWMLMDDDKVLEVAGDSANIVRNKNTYLLFYRRRLLAGSNVINLTSPY